MLIIWVALGSSVYLVNLSMKNVPGDFEKNGMYTSIFGVISVFIAQTLAQCTGISKSLIWLGIFATISSFLVMTLTDGASIWLSALYISSRHFFLNTAFAIVYMKHAALFPTFFLGTSLGICHFGKSFTMIFFPLLAEMDHPWPSVMVTICSVVWTLAATQIIEK